MADESTEVRAETVEDGGLAVTYSPAVIEANFDALERRVDETIAGYAEARYDLATDDAVREAKRDRAYLNGIAKEIGERLRTVKREYMRPYDEFEGRAKAITAKVKAAADNVKAQLDEAEARRRASAKGILREYYGEMAELLVPVVPYERIHEDRWLNKTFGEMKAKAAIDEKVAKIASDWDVLKAQRDMPRYAEAERAFFETLDLGAALAAAREAEEADERIARMREAVEGPAEAPEPAPAPVVAAPEPVAAPPDPAPAPPAPVAPPAPAEEACPWVIVVPSATRPQMEHAAKTMRVYGVQGVIRKGTVAQVYAREAADGR